MALTDNPQAYRLQHPLSRDDSAALARRRRARNLALLVVLLGLVGLFYAIAVVRLMGAAG